MTIGSTTMSKKENYMLPHDISVDEILDMTLSDADVLQ